jgi:uncharacterized SAM-binding protein YcdF (DUF218 family)
MTNPETPAHRAEPGGTRRPVSPVAGATGLCGARNSQRGGGLLWFLLLLLLLIVLGTIYLVRVPLLRAFADWWIVDEPLQKAQAIVVLGGDNLAADRVRHAVRLYRDAWAPKIVLSGGQIRAYLNESELMRRDARELGVPENDIIAAPTGTGSTLEEALRLRAVLAKHNFRKIIVVTSNFHTRRARTIYRHIYQPAGTVVVFSAAPDPAFPPDRWWQEREGRAALVFELLKLVYTGWELFHLPEPLPPLAFVCLRWRTAL